MKDKVAPNTPHLLNVSSVQGNEDSLIDLPPETKPGESKKSNEEEPQPVSLFQLFRYANTFEIFLMILGVICAIGSGCLVPINLFTFADLVNDIVNIDLESVTNTTAPKRTIYGAAKAYAIRNTIIGLAMFILVYISVMLFNYTSQRQAFRIRQKYLISVLHQDISWYDNKMKSGNVATALNEDVIKLEEGIGEKVPKFIDHMTIFVVNMVFAFCYGWKLALVCLVTVPITSVILRVVARITCAVSEKERVAFGEASSVAEEALSAIKTVVAFDGQKSELKRFNTKLTSSYKLNVKMGLASGCGFGLHCLGIYANYALSIWYGITLILEERHVPIQERDYDANVLIAVFFCTMLGAVNISLASPYIEVFSVSKAAAAKIFEIIESKPTISSLDLDSIKLATFQNLIEFKDVEFQYSARPDVGVIKDPSFCIRKGETAALVGSSLTGLEESIEFKNVEFQYPSRPDVDVLKNVSFCIKKGETVALVGISGCGKSTCMQLLQRFYDPVNGQILLDGRNLRDINVDWLRSIMGIVSQEPVLFDRTIAENILYGNLEASMEKVVEAAKQSNAHDFIMKLPLNYDTLVGERGTQLSGGQKQKIAIARALIRNPAILLLDEATSALDTQSESEVQDVLNKACEGRTTIIVAHRLTTICGASKIIVLSDGGVVGEGKHEELMKRNGYYRALVTDQESKPSESQQEPSAPNTHREQIGKDLEQTIITSKVSSEETNSKKTDSKAGMWQVLKLNKPEWKLLLIAGIASVVVGSSWALSSILLGDIIAILSTPDDDVVRHESAMYAIYYISGGVIIGTATFMQIFLLTIASERLTTRLRGFAFAAMLKQEMAWFDEPSNGVGALCAKLSTEAAAVKGATGQRIGKMLESISALLIGIGLSFYYEWRVALLAMAFVPILLGLTVMHGRVCNNETMDYHKSLEKSTKVAIEAAGNIRTVAGIGCEEKFYKEYVSAIRPALVQAQRNTHYRGIVYGLFNSVPYFGYSAVMLYGGYLIQNGEVDYSRVFKIIQFLIAGMAFVGQTAAFLPNFQKGVIAAGKIIDLKDRVPKIVDPKDPQEYNSVEVKVNFNKVSFEYPTRPGVTVLNTLDLEAEAGKTIALIGPSGCGKSTIIKLLERFYDPSSGTVACNGTNIATITQSSLRMSLSLVEQEPTIFARTIRENIAYGDNTKDVSSEDIIAAAKKANIDNFVTSLPLGYETKLGDKGTMLSGGQKQRVAIARALIRNPKILLLDEATSALDTGSEKIVQTALKKDKTIRTCILIAHRLSTVKDADKICVLHQGSIAEIGSHEELIQKRELYYNMLYPE